VSEERGGAAPAAAKAVTSEKMFRQRLTGALKKGSARELLSIWRDPQLEPHAHLFLMLFAAFFVGILIWILEPLLV